MSLSSIRIQSQLLQIDYFGIPWTYRFGMCVRVYVRTGIPNLMCKISFGYSVTLTGTVAAAATAAAEAAATATVA